nr:hypothetical protein [Tanacetum cinerariifolium]
MPSENREASLTLEFKCGDNNGTYHRDEKEPYVEKFVVEEQTLNGSTSIAVLKVFSTSSGVVTVPNILGNGCGDLPYTLSVGVYPFASLLLFQLSSFGILNYVTRRVDDLVLLDVEPVGLVLKAGSLLKFDMHIHRSSLTEIQVEWLVKCYGILADLHPLLSMAEFLRLPNFKGCKITAGALLPVGVARVAHLANPMATLEDIPPKTLDMTMAEIPCRRVLDDKEKMRKKLQLIPLSLSLRMGILWAQTNEHISPHANVDETATGEKAHANLAVEGHGDNEEGISGLKTQPTPICQHPEAAEKLARDKVVPDEEASYFADRFGNLPFTPQWGLTDSSGMDNSQECRDMMSNLFTPADHEF